MEQEHEIHWDKKNPTKLNLEYYETIGTFVKWILWGGFAISVVGLLGIFTTDLGVFGIIAILLRSMLIGILCVKAYKALTTRKENAIFLTKSILWYCFTTWILNCIISLAFSNILQILNFYSIIWLAACIAGVIYIYSDGEISTVFPKSFRHHSYSDLLLVLAAWLIPSIIEFIGGFVKAFVHQLS